MGNCMPREDNMCHSDGADHRTPMNFIDLFCGCGGFTVGMERAGFKCLAAIDFNEEAVTTMQSNLSHIKHVLHRNSFSQLQKSDACTSMARRSSDQYRSIASTREQSMNRSIRPWTLFSEGVKRFV